MKKEAVEALKKDIYYSGFDGISDSAIDRPIKNNVAKFSIPHHSEVKMTGHLRDTELHFNKWEKNEDYYFNGFTMTITDPKVTGEKVQGIQVGDFISKHYVNRNEYPFTKNETSNLMYMHAVLKEDFKDAQGKKVKAWAMLNPKETDRNGNHLMKYYDAFDVKELMVKNNVVTNYPDSVASKLEKGDIVNTIIRVNGEDVEKFYAINAKTKDFDYFTPDGKLITKQQEQREGENQGKKQSENVSVDQHQKENETQKTGRTAKQHV